MPTPLYCALGNGMRESWQRTPPRMGGSGGYRGTLKQMRSRTSASICLGGRLDTVLGCNPQQRRFDPGHGGRIVDGGGNARGPCIARCRCPLKNTRVPKFLEPSTLVLLFFQSLSHTLQMLSCVHDIGCRNLLLFPYPDDNQSHPRRGRDAGGTGRRSQ